MSDHIEAATITPEAKPNNAFCKRAGISFRIKNTKAEPNTVPISGINKPNIVTIIVLPFFILNAYFIRNLFLLCCDMLLNLITPDIFMG